MLTLRTTRDPVVPLFHEDLYRDKVAAAGRSSLLLQRRVGRYGHVNFSPAEIVAALLDLAKWVETGRSRPCSLRPPQTEAGLACWEVRRGGAHGKLREEA